jgi:AcrR family transcriptional regulator
VKQEDPERSIRLLWETPAEPSRGPKPGLSLDRIVAAGIAVADAEGLGALTMRRVAEQLGFTTMSLYRYVPGKAELLDLMLDAVHDELELPKGDWRAALESMAREQWKLYRAHPWAAALGGTRRMPGPRTMANLDASLAVVADLGLTGAEMVSVVTLVGQYVESAARRMADRAAAERETGVSEEVWWSKRGALWEHFTPDRFPMMTHVYLSGGFDHPLDEFEFGLRSVLDGIAAFIESEDRERVPLSTCDTE